MRTFQPLYFKDKLKIINPEGFIGIVTLWSSPEWVAKRLFEIGIDLSGHSSPIAVIGNLRGNGFPHLIRNLLYNPQITLLACCGRNRYGSLEDLISFFSKGVEQVEESSPYHLNGQTIPAARIRGRTRMIDTLVKPEDFDPKPEITYLGELRDSQSLENTKKYFSEISCGLHPSKSNNLSRPPAAAHPKKIPLPKVCVNTFPCNSKAFIISKKDVVQAWEEVIFILYRFGRTVHLSKGGRKELQNVKVIVEQPVSSPDQRLFKYWFKEDKIKLYQKDILSGEEPADDSYTYGHRLRSYFGIDGLAKVAERLLKDNEDRKCFIALWDTGNDLRGKSTPCLVSLFFRYYEKKLTLTAAYRTHNAIDAWIYNFYGLKAILDFVADKTDMEPGAITVISNSISIDLDESTIARAALLVEKSRKSSIKTDPNGNFIITVDKQKNEIIVQHCTEDGLLINEYRGKKAESIQHKLYKDMALSDLNHAMYIGRQLAQAEMSLKYGFEFIQK
ncbi:MAG: hypothetical protein DRH24_06000 [Deltaproteobacteria bacterium]|nr:MAG: hypothetical protein DRH24_06000 [Deltaproteobacteria bacterium]